LNINFSLSLTKFLQLLNLAIFTTLSLFNLLAEPTPHLLSLSPGNHLLLENYRSLIYICITSSLKSTSGFILSASPVLSRFTSLSTSQLISVIIPTLVIHHSFTSGSKPTFLTNPSHRRFLLPTGLPHDNGTGPDLLCSSFYF